MSENLTKKEKGFADDYLDTGNGTRSALNNYDTQDENSAASIASQNLRKLKILDYLQSQSEAVSSNMVRLALNAENENVQVSAGKDVLDRAGFKPIDKIDHTTKGEKIEMTGISAELAKEYEEKLKDNL